MMAHLFILIKNSDVMRSMRAPVIILILLSTLLVVPALAGTNYLDGTPNLTAYIAGTNEYMAGDDIQIPVVIDNNGMSLDQQVASNIIDRDDPPTTAKFVTVAMSASSASQNMRHPTALASG